MTTDREVLTYQQFGTGTRDLAQPVVDSGLAPETRSIIDCDYVRPRADRWIDFPWSSEPPVTAT